MRKILLFGLIFCYLTIIKANNPGYLGIMIRDFAGKQITGVQVVNVFDDGAAKQYGLKENDIITFINEIPVAKDADLTGQLARYNWGDAVIINYIRNGKAAVAKVYLGYKGSTRTYNVTRKENDSLEHWLFADDKSEVIMSGDNKVISISKTNEKGNTDTWIPGQVYKAQEVPQYFLDLEDKTAAINSIKKDQAKRNCTNKEIVYIKTLIPFKEDKPFAVELNVEQFSITPNPGNGQFIIHIKSAEKGTGQLIIFDITGRIVRTEQLNSFAGEYNKFFNLENEQKGAYLIQLTIGENRTSRKIILQ